MQAIKEIKLVNGGSTLVDEQDYEYLIQFRWFRSTQGYAFRQGWDGIQNKGGKHWTVWMHRAINQTPPNLFTDHINGNKLDNRRCNLRTCNKAQNAVNTGKPEVKNSTSKYKGVSLHRKTGLWRSRFHCVVDGKTKERCTYHKTPEQAALDFNRMAIEQFGEFASLNSLPDEVQPTERRQKSSKYRGVTFHRKSGKWRAAIDIDGVTTHISQHNTEEEAARAYNVKALAIRGDKARVNQL